MTDASLFGDFDTDPDSYDRMVHVRETPHGIFRAVVEHDDYPDAPDYDMDCPVIQAGDYHFRAPDLETVSGADSAEHDGLPMSLPEAIDRAMRDDYGHHVRDLSEALEIVDRWLRVYHGGSLTTISSSTDRRGSTYVVYDTRAMRGYWGQTGEMLETSDPDAPEWQAYIDGEVYVVSVERATAFDEDDEPCGWDVVEGPIGGHYGDDWAAQAALDMLDAEVEHTAADMLPVERWDGESEGYGSCGVKDCTDCT